ncbi:hypothetical protein BFP97_01050 [Roseivirga sp. 4D4]|uniref:hypothetical protein n=1 Tax=Roseivirga sp. 4D4 TaxID=1889784 RepID=UPI0008530F48|nr:hypothetical protein [Roseivirga sp. 4D4]OEK00186.1 hypothetical protein BFP97_01050 [Roseivirga sp. 4D4]
MPKRKTPDSSFAPAPAPKSKRTSKPPFLTAIAGLDFIKHPTYEDSRITGAGGREAQAILGPTGSYLSVRSDANPKLPSAIVPARKKMPKCSFKAGHLLNAQFGGDGTKRSNLTILSSKGNANHKAFDEPVKKALLKLKDAYKLLWEDNVDVKSVKIGIDVKVVVNIDQPWPENPKIFKSLTCAAKCTPWQDQMGKLGKHKSAFKKLMSEIDKLCKGATQKGEILNPKVG